MYSVGSVIRQRRVRVEEVVATGRINRGCVPKFAHDWIDLSDDAIGLKLDTMDCCGSRK